jgi:hypothetical protein
MIPLILAFVLFRSANSTLARSGEASLDGECLVCMRASHFFPYFLLWITTPHKKTANELSELQADLVVEKQDGIKNTQLEKAFEELQEADLIKDKRDGFLTAALDVTTLTEDELSPNDTNLKDDELLDAQMVATDSNEESFAQEPQVLSEDVIDLAVKPEGTSRCLIFLRTTHRVAPFTLPLFLYCVGVCLASCHFRRCTFNY